MHNSKFIFYTKTMEFCACVNDGHTHTTLDKNLKEIVSHILKCSLLCRNSQSPVDKRTSLRLIYVNKWVVNASVS